MIRLEILRSGQSLIKDKGRKSLMDPMNSASPPRLAEFKNSQKAYNLIGEDYRYIYIYIYIYMND